MSLMWIHRKGAVDAANEGWIYNKDYARLGDDDKERYQPCTYGHLPVGCDITAAGVIIYGFKLSRDGKLSGKLLNAIAQDELVEWSFEGEDGSRG